MPPLQAGFLQPSVGEEAAQRFRIRNSNFSIFWRVLPLRILRYDTVSYLEEVRWLKEVFGEGRVA